MTSEYHYGILQDRQGRFTYIAVNGERRILESGLLAKPLINGSKLVYEGASNCDAIVREAVRRLNLDISLRDRLFPGDLKEVLSNMEGQHF